MSQYIIYYNCQIKVDCQLFILWWSILVCPDKKIYYVTCFRVIVFCNKCPLSILTQVFVSYFCFLTSKRCTISCWRTNHINVTHWITVWMFVQNWSEKGPNSSSTYTNKVMFVQQFCQMFTGKFPQLLKMICLYS